MMARLPKRFKLEDFQSSPVPETASAKKRREGRFNRE
jgi:hypothetical protein